MHYYKGNPSKLPYICIVWFNQNGSHLMTPVFRESEFIIECFGSFWIFQIEKHYISPGGVWNLTLPEANMTLGFESIFWKEGTSISSTFVFQLVFCIFFHAKMVKRTSRLEICPHNLPTNASNLTLWRLDSGPNLQPWGCCSPWRRQCLLETVIFLVLLLMVQKSPVDMVNILIIYRVFYISQVVVWHFWTINSMLVLGSVEPWITKHFRYLKWRYLPM